MLKSYSIVELDQPIFTRVSSLLQELLASTDSEKILELELPDTIASATMAGKLVSLIHASNVDLHIKASGILSPGATIIAAAGDPGFRSASCTTKFGLTESGKKLGTKQPSLDENYVLQFLSILCKDKRYKIKDAFIDYGAAYATDAVSLSIIDKVSDFNDKYAAKKEAIKQAKKKSPKSKKSEVANVKPVSPLSEEEHAEVMEKAKNIETPEEEAGK